MDFEQLDIFTYLKDCGQQLVEPPILLRPGQTIYKAVKADVEKRIVTADTSYLCGENNEDRGYRLLQDNGLYDIALNSTIGTVFFTDLTVAKKVAADYLAAHKDGIILAKDIKPVSVSAYSFIRKDGAEKIAFYADLGNGNYYVRGFMTYDRVEPEEKAMREFMQQKEFAYYKITEKKKHKPQFKTMYKCTNTDSGWLYAENKFAAAVG